MLLLLPRQRRGVDDERRGGARASEALQEGACGGVSQCCPRCIRSKEGAEERRLRAAAGSGSGTALLLLRLRDGAQRLEEGAV